MIEIKKQGVGLDPAKYIHTIFPFVYKISFSTKTGRWDNLMNGFVKFIRDCMDPEETTGADTAQKGEGNTRPHDQANS